MHAEPFCGRGRGVSTQKVQAAMRDARPVSSKKLADLASRRRVISTLPALRRAPCRRGMALEGWGG